MPLLLPHFTLCIFYHVRLFLTAWRKAEEVAGSLALFVIKLVAVPLLCRLLGRGMYPKGQEIFVLVVGAPLFVLRLPLPLHKQAFSQEVSKKGSNSYNGYGRRYG